jgi:hypothetical protein
MCKFFSAVVMKDRILYDLDIDSHEKILSKFGIKDESHFPNFVRVETTPIDGNVFNHNLDNWAVRVDQDFKPEWFDVDHYTPQIKEALQEHFKQRFIIDEQTWQKREDQRLWVKNSNVEARGNSSVEARENSSVEAWGNSSVEAWGNSSVEARENSSVEAWENSSVVARGNSSVVARENSSVVAWGNSSVVAWGNSSVVAWENSQILIPYSQKIQVKEIHDMATVKDIPNKKIIVATDFKVERR